MYIKTVRKEKFGIEMKKSEVIELIHSLKNIFDIVRIVDVSLMREFEFSEDGEMRSLPYQCYAVWNRSSRCENCISARAFSGKCQMTKFEFIEKDVYFVVSKYVEMDETPYMLEMVMKVTDETLFGAYGLNDFIETINGYNRRLYIDGLTGAYNRNYYNEQLKDLPKINALAMVDIDNFKTINDSFGHPVGDFILQKVVQMMKSLVRSTDAVIRFGGDEFILAFSGISKDILEQRLEQMRAMVAEHTESQYPNLQVTLSIGAVYSDKSGGNMLKRADDALYRAKKLKNCVCVEDF